MKKAITAYKKNQTDSSVAYADPHKLIEMLLTAAIDNTSKSIGFIGRKDFKNKGEHITKAMDIVAALQQSLSNDDNEIRNQLFDLYEFCLTSLSKGSIDMDTKVLDSVLDVLKKIREGWESIPASERGKKSNGVISSSISESHNKK